MIRSESNEIFESLNDVKEFYFPNKDLNFLEGSNCDMLSDYISQFINEGHKKKDFSKKTGAEKKGDSKNK